MRASGFLVSAVGRAAVVGSVLGLLAALGACSGEGPRPRADDTGGLAVRAQEVLGTTATLSREYLALRYRTDTVLVGAGLMTPAAWQAEMTDVIADWKELERRAAALGPQAEALAGAATRSATADARGPRDRDGRASRGGARPGAVTVVLAAEGAPVSYDRDEISNIFDAAPAGKKIATLAKHLGVDARRAWAILQQDQAQVEADAWNDAGDTFSRLETTATVVKDGCKIAGFVGTIALTGGTAALVTGSALTKASVIVSGADLVLEVTDDAARIALGNHNRISTLAGTARSVTEPVAGLLTIVGMPGNLSKGIEKLNAVTFTAEQINSFAQENKVIGVQVPEFTIPLTDPYANLKKHRGPVYVSRLSRDEIDTWLRSTGADPDADDLSVLTELLGLDGTDGTDGTEPSAVSPSAEGTPDAPATRDGAVGSSLAGTSWAGELTSVIGGSHELQVIPMQITLKAGGVLVMAPTEGINRFTRWKQVGGTVRLSGGGADGYLEFRVETDGLYLTAIQVGGTRLLAGADFMDGTVPEGTLYRR